MIGEGIRSEAKRHFGKKVLVPVLASLALISACGEQKGTSSAESSAPASASSPANAQVQFRFDNLGSTAPGAEYINVYPGPLDTPADKKKNGTFNNKDVVDALCIATGRKLVPDPKYQESSRPEDVQDKWVEVNDDPAQFASLTYGQLVPLNAQLPPCKDVP